MHSRTEAYHRNSASSISCGRYLHPILPIASPETLPGHAISRGRHPAQPFPRSLSTVHGPHPHPCMPPSEGYDPAQKSGMAGKSTRGQRHVRFHIFVSFAPATRAVRGTCFFFHRLRDAADPSGTSSADHCRFLDERAACPIDDDQARRCFFPSRRARRDIARTARSLAGLGSLRRAFLHSFSARKPWRTTSGTRSDIYKRLGSGECSRFEIRRPGHETQGSSTAFVVYYVDGCCPDGLHLRQRHAAAQTEEASGGQERCGRRDGWHRRWRGGGPPRGGPRPGGGGPNASASASSLASGIGSRLTSLVSNRYSQYVVSTLLRRKSGPAPVVESPVPKLAPYVDFHESNASLYSDSNTLVNSTRPAYTSSSSSSSSVIFDDDTTLLEHPKRLVEPIKEVPEAVAEACDNESYIKSFFHSHANELGQTQHLHYYQLPFAWRENRFIITGYRFYDSHQKSALSILNWYGWHNETSNIWTHLLGGLYLLYLAFVDFPHSQVWESEQVPLPAKFIVYIFLFAGIKCLFASVFWHTFNGTSVLKLRSKFACVDYSGITLLITASIMTAEFVTMYDNKFCLYLYMLVSSVLGMFGIFMNWSPKFDRPEARPLRIKFFILLSTMGFLSVFQLAWEKSWAYTSWLMLPVTKKSLVWYLIGVFFYGSFIPERFRSDFLVDESIPTEAQLSSDMTVLTRHKHIHFRAEPTKHPKAVQCSCHARSFKSLWWVDYFGCSHMIWHFFVVLGVIGHYHAILDMFIKRWII